MTLLIETAIKIIPFLESELEQKLRRISQINQEIEALKQAIKELKTKLSESSHEQPPIDRTEFTAVETNIQPVKGTSVQCGWCSS